MTFRGYREVTGEDRSGLGHQVSRQLARVADRLRDVKRVVAIVSGKGGVGKSYLTASLARALARRGSPTGVLDADLESPTVAAMLGARGPLVVHDDGVDPAVSDDGISVISMDLLLADGAPLRFTREEAAGHAHTWRGVAQTGALREFFSDVRWGALDVLLVDMPPDAHRLPDLAELLPPTHLSGAIAVTIPSEESRRSVTRAMRAASDAGVPVLGVVENMSGYACRSCGTVGPLFDGDAGARLAQEFDVPLLARIPFDPKQRLATADVPPSLLAILIP